MSSIHAPGMRWRTFLLAALSLSIGWGIRGNFGHEYGAMIPGALTAIAVCILSGREDWRRRVVFFGMFGALGWGFGGSISYMQVISYTHSGHAPSQLYGFIALFWIGFLWAGLGGSGTALPAVADRKRLDELLKPLLWIFAIWTILKFGEEPLAKFYKAAVWGDGEFDKSALRHQNPFYWFDSDWLQALCALAAICLYDLWDRLRRGFSKPLLEIPCLILLPVLGGGLGWLADGQLQQLHVTPQLARYLVVYQGDTSRFEPAALMTNWPQFFSDIHAHLGLAVGGLIGVALYFALFGQWRSGASLYLHMALGWFAVFLLVPVLGPVIVRIAVTGVASLSGGAISPDAFALENWGGLRLTPPRGDDWAGITGVFLGAVIYCFRKGLRPVAYTGILSGIVGGLGFSGAAWLKLMMVSLGNPNLAPDAASDPFWVFWQGANWHSFLEQSYGFINGLGIALAMGLLSTRLSFFDPDEDHYVPRRWTSVVAAAFVILLIPYVNVFKNVTVWANEAKVVPEQMRVPLIGGLGENLQFSSSAWFNITYLLFAVVILVLLIGHTRRPLALIPNSSLGRGQLLYLGLLWTIIIANFERALVGFTEQRILTEWVIVINALLATLLVLLTPKDEDMVVVSGEDIYSASDFLRMLTLGVAASLCIVLAQFYAVRAVYGGTFAGHAGYRGQAQMRFGENAEWRIRPILKTQEHR
ncbi:MAG: hypothetical protein K1Y02_18715 [Candidatus Hydrogenedentes bacterium]|nr:hypothetical protein [Candidatus Hydrogenedentota bacterium]